MGFSYFFFIYMSSKQNTFQLQKCCYRNFLVIPASAKFAKEVEKIWNILNRVVTSFGYI